MSEVRTTLRDAIERKCSVTEASENEP